MSTITAHFRGGPWHGRVRQVQDCNHYNVAGLPELYVNGFDLTAEPRNEPISYQEHRYRKDEPAGPSNHWLFLYVPEDNQ